MYAEPISDAQQPNTGRERRRGRWDPSYAAVAITLIGGLAYTFLRLAYGSFYAALHTTPEEVGLNYSQTIVRGVIPSLTIAMSVFMAVALLLVILISIIGYFGVGFNLLRMLWTYWRSLRRLRAQIQPPALK
jgi:hypothetical protein